MNNALKLVAAATLTLILGSTAMASTTDLDFSDWDPNALSSDGGMQTFADICGDIDVTVTASGEFDEPSYYLSTLAGGTNAISTSHAPGTGSNTHSYTFDFSTALDLIVETMSLDGQEQYLIESNGSEAYTNLEGMAPVVSSSGTGILLEGTGFGGDPVSGAADGQTAIGGATSITVTYIGDPGNFSKYGSFRLLGCDCAVPEPSSGALLLVGALTILRRRRR